MLRYFVTDFIFNYNGYCVFFFENCILGTMTKVFFSKLKFIYHYHSKNLLFLLFFFLLVKSVFFFGHPEYRLWLSGAIFNTLFKMCFIKQLITAKQGIRDKRRICTTGVINIMTKMCHMIYHLP